MRLTPVIFVAGLLGYCIAIVVHHRSKGKRK